jgi:nucleoside-diphosphate-sugar epimerase
MKVFVAGSTGAIGASLVPQLLEEGHEVTALLRSRSKAGPLEAAGVKVVVADALDREALTAAVQKSEPEVVLHQLTALAGATWNFKRFDEDFALTNRLRTEVTSTLLAAARLVGARRFVAQSYCGWPYARTGSWVKTEEDALDPQPPPSFRRTLAAIRSLEEQVSRASDVGGVVLSVAKDGAMVRLVRARQLPVVGDGAGVWSFVHVHDAARAMVASMTNGAPGVYNVVDDEPAPVARWVPALAELAQAPAPRRVPAWLARFAIGAGGVSMMTQVRGGSNAKAKRELRWQLRYPAWERGFAETLAGG